MTWSYVAGRSDRDTVRLLIPDTKPGGGLFEDEEIDVFLDLEDGDVRYAAADALEAIARNQSLLLRAINVFELQLDPQQTGRMLLDSAKTLREQSDSTDDAFDWAEQVTSPSAFAQRVLNQWVRGAV